jgi:hypothetical protein
MLWPHCLDPTGPERQGYLNPSTHSREDRHDDRTNAALRRSEANKEVQAMAARVLAGRRLFWYFHPCEISIFRVGQGTGSTAPLGPTC